MSSHLEQIDLIKSEASIPEVKTVVPDSFHETILNFPEARTNRLILFIQDIES